MRPVASFVCQDSRRSISIETLEPGADVNQAFTDQVVFNQAPNAPRVIRQEAFRLRPPALDVAEEDLQALVVSDGVATHSAVHHPDAPRGKLPQRNEPRWQEVR